MLIALLLTGAAGLAASPTPLQAFSDGVKHYQDGSGRSAYPRYPTDAQRAIAENILRYQRENGGWASNWDPLRILSTEEVAALTADRAKTDTTLDNRATYPEVEFLSQAYLDTGDVRFRDGALRGLAFLFEAQYANGGWPHSYPSRENYRPHITFMDDVMSGVLSTLRRVADGTVPFTFVPQETRARAADAVRRGDALLLQLQVVVAGVPTVWAGQYDEVTLQPTQGRSFELPSLVSSESVGVVRYLMSIEAPSPAVRASITHAIAWFEKARIEGIRVDTIPIEPIRYENHTATFDRIVVADPKAPPLWARFYEIDSNRPFMANRDGIKVYNLAEVSPERRSGYGWYTTLPTSLLSKDYPAWRDRWDTP